MILSTMGNNQSGKGKGESGRHEVREVVRAEDHARTPVFISKRDIIGEI